MATGPERRRMTALIREECKQHCAICGRSQKLTFHHLRDKKGNVASEPISKSVKKTLDEIQKCVVLCWWCHEKVHRRKPVRHDEWGR